MSANIKGELTLEEVVSDTGCIKHLCPVDGDGMSILTVVEHDGVKFAAVYDDDEARRLVACWNATLGIPVEMLEAMPHGPASLLPMYARLEAQRDELLAALDGLLNVLPSATTHPEIKAAKAAMANATKEAS